MSAGITRDQERALLAHRHVLEVQEKGPDYSRKYGSMAFKLPVLVHNAGLVAAMHFVAARGSQPQREVLEHLAKQLQQAGFLKGSGSEALLQALREAEMARTRALTREVQRCLNWYKRFTQSVLKVYSTDEDDDSAETAEAGTGAGGTSP